MIDALELSVPVAYHIKRSLLQRFRPRPANRNTPYLQRLDLRPELSLVIQYGSKHPIARSKQNYNIQFKGVRYMTAADFYLQLRAAFGMDDPEISALRVARVDFAANVPNMPVEWFRERCYVRYKRTSTQWRATTNRGITTLTIGKRPDVFRIYDKIQEMKDNHRDILTGWAKVEPTVTRVERQCSARAIPQSMRSLGELLANAEKADPFAALILKATAGEPNTHNWGPAKWLMNLGLYSAVQQYGQQEVRARLNRKGHNATRIFNRYSDLLKGRIKGIGSDQLRQLYQASTIMQLNQPRNGKYPLGGYSCLL